MIRNYRWGKDDRFWGPVTYTTRSGHEALGVVLSSGDQDGDSWAGGHDGPTLGVFMGRFTAFLVLPRWLLPAHETWVEHSGLPAGGYWSRDRRDLGVKVTRSGAVGSRYDHLQVDLGRQTLDSSTTRGWGCFLPWQAERLVRWTLLTPTLEVHEDFFEPGPRLVPRWLDRRLPGFVVRRDSLSESWTRRNEARRRSEALCPGMTYELLDYDGEPVTAFARLEEGEWRRGEGWFSWLDWLCRPTVIQRVDLTFSKETGERKGSWKGGTLSSSFPAQVADDLHRSVCHQLKKTRMTLAAGPALAPRCPEELRR